MTSILLWKDIVQISDRICKIYNLEYLDKIVPETHKLTERFGQIDRCKACKEKDIPDIKCKHKIISVRLNGLGKRRKKPLHIKTILDTLAHELAHLRFWVHGRRHTRFRREIKNSIREMGYEV